VAAHGLERRPCSLEAVTLLGRNGGAPEAGDGAAPPRRGEGARPVPLRLWPSSPMGCSATLGEPERERERESRREKEKLYFADHIWSRS